MFGVQVMGCHYFLSDQLGGSSTAIVTAAPQVDVEDFCPADTPTLAVMPHLAAGGR
jgi:hypothetical protein